MANTVQSELLQDGPRNAILKLTAQMPAAGGAEIAYTQLVSPNTTLGAPGVGPLSYFRDNTFRANFLNIHNIKFNVSDGLTVNLWWDQGNTSADLIESVYGRGEFKYGELGELPNNATSATGIIGFSTSGYTSGTPYWFTIILWMNKLLAQ